jgi:hypothetical protein
VDQLTFDFENLLLALDLRVLGRLVRGGWRGVEGSVEGGRREEGGGRRAEGRRRREGREEEGNIQGIRNS